VNCLQSIRGIGLKIYSFYWPNHDMGLLAQILTQLLYSIFEGNPVQSVDSMPKLFRRIIVLMLVPCLVGDVVAPAIASPNVSRSSFSSLVYSLQAINPELAMSELTELDILGQAGGPTGFRAKAGAVRQKESHAANAKRGVPEAIEVMRAYFHAGVKYWSLRHAYLKRLSRDPSLQGNDPHLNALALKTHDAALSLHLKRNEYIKWAQELVRRSRRRQWNQLKDARAYANQVHDGYAKKSTELEALATSVVSSGAEMVRVLPEIELLDRLRRYRMAMVRLTEEVRFKIEYLAKTFDRVFPPSNDVPSKSNDLQTRIWNYLKLHPQQGYTPRVLTELLGLDFAIQPQVTAVLKSFVQESKIHSRNHGRLGRAVLYSVSSQPDNGIAYDANREVDPKELPEKIMEVMHRFGKPMSVPLIRYELNDWGVAFYETQMKYLVDRGQVIVVGRGREKLYALPVPAAPADQLEGDCRSTRWAA
jgi:hypothetical protein